MPPMLHTNRDEPKVTGAPTQDSNRPALHGWGGIEDHLMKHDTGWVKDYGDDIDAILVFAGLFSAVLTAFLAQTYTLLQPGTPDSTGQLLAYQISTSPFMSTVPPSINATISSLLSPSPSSPSNAVRWINSLFFVSLVLSLASAFFGILAKQWMREYMQWNSPLGAPRENVLVRQLRIEAWEDWKVSAFISSIPALLELAMVLFLIGVTILLWTLDNIVAITVTVAIVLFLVVAMSLTVLPVFSDRCPYKSPTAWACIAAWHVAQHNSLPLLRQAQHKFFLLIRQALASLNQEEIVMCLLFPPILLPLALGICTLRLVIDALMESPLQALKTLWEDLSGLSALLLGILLEIIRFSCGILLQLYNLPRVVVGKLRRAFATPLSPINTTWRARDLDALNNFKIKEDVINGARIMLCKEDLAEHDRIRQHIERNLDDEHRSATRHGISSSESIPQDTTHRDPCVNTMLESEAVNDKTVEALLRDISETALLMKVLVWVGIASQDIRVATYVDQCVDTIHPDVPSGMDAAEVSRIRSVGLMSMIRSLNAHGNLHHPHATWYPPLDHDEGSSLHGITAHARFYTLSIGNVPWYTPHFLRIGHHTNAHESLTPQELSYTSLFLRLIAAHISQSALALSMNPSPSAPARLTALRTPTLIRRIYDSTILMNFQLGLRPSQRLPVTAEESSRQLAALRSVLQSEVMEKESRYNVAATIGVWHLLVPWNIDPRLGMTVYDIPVLDKALTAGGESCAITARASEQKDLESLLLNYFNLDKLDHCRNSSEDFAGFFRTADLWATWLCTLEAQSIGANSQTSPPGEVVWDKISDWIEAYTPLQSHWSYDATKSLSSIFTTRHRDNDQLQALLSESKGFHRAIHAVGTLIPKIMMFQWWSLEACMPIHDILLKAHEGKDDCAVRLHETSGRCPWINHHCDINPYNDGCPLLFAYHYEPERDSLAEDATPDTEAVDSTTSTSTAHMLPTTVDDPISDAIHTSSESEELLVIAVNENSGELRSGSLGRGLTTRAVSTITRFFRGLGSEFQTRRSPSSAPDDLQNAVEMEEGRSASVADPRRTQAAQAVEDEPLESPVDVDVGESPGLLQLEPVDDPREVNVQGSLVPEGPNTSTSRTEERDRPPHNTLRHSEGSASRSRRITRDDFLRAAAELSSSPGAEDTDPSRPTTPAAPGVAGTRHAEVEVAAVKEAEVELEDEEGRELGEARETMEPEEWTPREDEDPGRRLVSSESQSHEDRAVDDATQKAVVETSLDKRPRTYSRQSLDYEDAPPDAVSAPPPTPDAELLEAHEAEMERVPDAASAASDLWLESSEADRSTLDGMAEKREDRA